MTFCPQAWRQAQRLLVVPDHAAGSAPAQAGSATASSALAGTDVDSLAERIRREHAPGSAFADRGITGPLLKLGCQLLATAGEDHSLRQRADARRRELVGDTVTYVLNRNLNPGNRCVLRCGFCAFRRDEAEAGHYRLARPELLAMAAAARAAGATELCLQGGLDPVTLPAGHALEGAATLLRDLKAAAPGLHLHAFSPQELVFIALQDDRPLDQVIERLIDAGLGSVPGTAAEVLVERVRRLICPEKLGARAWVAAMLQVHRQGLASTATLMAGHLEHGPERVAHLLTLAALQRHARAQNHRGFTEFVLLPFVGAAAPAPLRARVARDQPDAGAMLRLTAQARLLLDHWIVHHQPSWVKLTLPVATEALLWGCDDIGGTLMDEHITTMAGARGGTSQTPGALRQAITSIGRPARQRTTLYGGVAAAAP